MLYFLNGQFQHYVYYSTFIVTDMHDPSWDMKEKFTKIIKRLEEISCQ